MIGRLRIRVLGQGNFSASVMCIAFILAALLSLPALSATTNKDAVAVIIGNKDYVGSVPDVDFAHNDAEAMKRFIIDVLGYREGNIIDLRDATQAKLQSTFGNERTHQGKLWSYLDPKCGSFLLPSIACALPGGCP